MLSYVFAGITVIVIFQSLNGILNSYDTQVFFYQKDTRTLVKYAWKLNTKIRAHLIRSHLINGEFLFTYFVFPEQFSHLGDYRFYSEIDQTSIVTMRPPAKLFYPLFYSMAMKG